LKQLSYILSLKMSKLDYSKWDHIEISDDEDDTHPNVDTASLFRWRHQARLDREEQRNHEWDAVKRGKSATTNEIKELEKKLNNHSLTDVEAAKLKLSKAELKKQEDEFKKKEEALKLKDQETPWNVDTICKDGFSKTAINKITKEENISNLSDDDFMKVQRAYQDKYEKELKEYGMLSKAEESKKFLQNHPQLVCDKAANFLVVWCVDLEVEEKHSLVERVAHQTIILQFILQLSTSMKADPRDCYVVFFKKFQKLEADYMKSFTDELDAFKVRIRERAQVRIDEAMKKYEEEEREKMMGPGGLHPGDVMESLPEELRACFESQNIPMLQQAIAAMDKDDASYHLKRCIDSGLWVPGKDSEDEEEPEEEPEEEAEEKPEEQAGASSSSSSKKPNLGAGDSAEVSEHLLQN